MKKKTEFLIVLAGILACYAPAFASNELAKAVKSTNITVDSNELEPFAINKKEEDDRIKFYESGNTTVGFNDSGDPAVENRF